MYILVLNAGSSSQKTQLYRIDEMPSSTAAQPLWTANADWRSAQGKAELTIHGNGQTIKETIDAHGRRQIVQRILQTLWQGPTRVISGPDEITAVGHRVVHGGTRYQETLITDEVKTEIRQLATFAPLHNPANLDGIEACEQILGSLPQVAVYDTAFHQTLPLEAIVYPGPYSWFEEGIRRYGFHGISHQYCARRSAEIVERSARDLRIVNCHLGNGCSLAAIQDGRSIDTTMGFTPLEGLMMGSRSGSLDPGILPYLQRRHGYSPEQLEQILNKESGLKGISGFSSDMRSILEAIAEGNERAQLALDIYIYRLRAFIGAMIASLGGIDVLTFTGGVGENAALVRARTCEAFAFLGLKIDPGLNEATPRDSDIATSASTVRVLVIHTEEDWEIARTCRALIKK